MRRLWAMIRLPVLPGYGRGKHLELGSSPEIFSLPIAAAWVYMAASSWSATNATAAFFDFSMDMFLSFLPYWLLTSDHYINYYFFAFFAALTSTGYTSSTSSL